jgi:drug/metabolite transporter (DMT)-like permease
VITGAWWAVVAGVGFGIFQALNRRALLGLDVYVSTFFQLLISTVVLVAASLTTQDLRLLGSAPPEALAYFGLAGFIHFFAGWTLLNASQKLIGAARTSPLIGTVPLWGTLLAALVLREWPTIPVWLGIILTVAGVLLISTARVEMAEGVSHPARPIGALDRFWTGVGLGLLTALCWATSPIFTRLGLAGLPSPLIGVTVGMGTSAAAYGLALAGRGSPVLASREALLFKGAAGVLVGLSTWARWVALDRAPVAVVLALTSLSVPTALVLAPLIAGQEMERVTARVWVGGGLVIMGSLLLVLLP